MKHITDFIKESLEIDTWFTCDSFSEFKDKFYQKLFQDGYVNKAQAEKLKKDDLFYADGKDIVDAESGGDIDGCYVVDDGKYIDVYYNLVQYFINKRVIRGMKNKKRT